MASASTTSASSSAEPPGLVIRPEARWRGRAELAQFARRVQLQVAGGRTFSCLVASGAELRALNRNFRQKNRATDVLSFPAPPAAPTLGDVAISIDHARAQARQFGHTILEEVSILLLHGVLHLVGMDHESDRGEMRAAEAEWRRRLGLPAGLIERTEAR